MADGNWKSFVKPRGWFYKPSPINMKCRDVAPRYESGSVMVVECSWGPVTIRPRVK